MGPTETVAALALISSVITQFGAIAIALINRTPPEPESLKSQPAKPEKRKGRIARVRSGVRMRVRQSRRLVWSLVVLSVLLSVAAVALVWSESLTKLQVTSVDREANLEKILDTLDDSDGDILISATFAAYGDFSYPEFFSRYVAVLMRKNTGVRRVMFVGSPAFLKTELRSEFLDRWNLYTASKIGTSTMSPIEKQAAAQFATMLGTYVAERRLTFPENFDQLIEVLMAGELRTQDELKNSGIEIYEATSPLPFGIWVAGSEAAFTAAGDVFRTGERQFVALLRTTAEAVSKGSPRIASHALQTFARP